MRLITAVAITLLVCSCATAYKSSGFSGGFSEIQLDTNVWKVSFAGNGYTSGQRTEDLALFRCAELTLDKGYTHFALLESNRHNKTSVLAAGVTKPDSSNMIAMYQGKPDTKERVFDARFVCQSIGARYGETCGEKR